MSALDWVLLATAAVLSAVLALWLTRRTRRFIIRHYRKAVLGAVRQFELHLERYKLVNRRLIRAALLEDSVIREAIAGTAAARNSSEAEVTALVEEYIDEIVPFFNVLSYYKLGYNVSRILLTLLYKTSSEYQDQEALNAIPRKDVVVYLMNHRSNADYVVVAYVLARVVSISYAVGEWARVWPLEYIFKSFGAYFIRRRYREELYHTVLERYVQLITRNGVTQGIFLEGGLSRDGFLRPAKIGLLDYIVRTIRDPRFERDIRLVPVAINYDRVLEDRSLTRELVDRERVGRLRQLAYVAGFFARNLTRLLTGRLKRYGRVAVNFGTPVSVRDWLDEHPGVLEKPRTERLSELQGLADDVLARIASIIPITPVPLVAAALLSFEQTVIEAEDLLRRIERYRDHLVRENAKLLHAEKDPEAILERAWRMLKLRRMVLKEGERYVILPRHRPLLEYYSNSIRHLLPEETAEHVMHPAHEPESDLPRLGRWKPR